VQVVADAVAGATSLSVAALDAPVIRGTVLDFDGGGMAAVVELVVTATAPVGAVALAVNALPGPVTNLAFAYDNGVTVAEAARVLKAIQYATSRVKLYCCSRYDDSQLATAWSVNRWATVLAGRWLAKRRAQACPQGIESDFDEVMEELKGVRMSFLNVEDIGTRTAGWPFVTNLTVPVGYDVAQVRVEPAISEGTPTQYGQFIDWGSVFIADFYY
jgi:hypothetical protein